MRFILSVVLATSVAGTTLATAAEPAPQSRSAAPEGAAVFITIDEALRLALAVSPQMGAAEARLRAAQGGRQQAGVLPNPEISIEWENFGGRRAYDGFDQLETTYGVSQRIEIGGQRQARLQAADADIQAVSHRLDSARLEVARALRKAYIDAAAAASHEALAADRLRLAGEVERAVAARVQAGREPPIQAAKAEINRRQAETALGQARRQETMARGHLALLVGRPADALKLDESWFAHIVPAPSPVPTRATDHPDLRWQEANLLRSEALLDVEDRRSIPDITVSAGVRRFRNSHETAFLAGISVPLPLFDGNQGAKARARAETAAAAAELAAARRDHEASLLNAQGAVLSARETVLALKADILPVAERAFTAADEGYRAGKFTYLDVLDAQRTLFEARAALIDALAAYHQADADWIRLTDTTGTVEGR